MWSMSVRSKPQKTFAPWTFALVSINIKLSPIRSIPVTPVIGVGVFAFDDFIKVCMLFKLFLSLHFFNHCCDRKPPWLWYLMTIISSICNLSNSVRLFISYPKDTLRKLSSVRLNPSIVCLYASSSIYVLFQSSLSTMGALLTVMESRFVILLLKNSLTWSLNAVGKALLFLSFLDKVLT